MKWELIEDEIVCNYYLNHRSLWRESIDIIMNELKQSGFNNRDIESVKMRISNY